MINYEIENKNQLVKGLKRMGSNFDIKVKLNQMIQMKLENIQ